TPRAPSDLQRTLSSLASRGGTHAVMDTSAPSLDQGRLDGVAFAAAVFTNLTRDHLHYHGTMEAYLAAKLRLSTLLRLEGVEVVNLDEEAWRSIPGRAPRLTFGFHPGADVRATDVTLDASGSTFHLNGRFGGADVALPLLGDFNVANALAAAAAALALELPVGRIVERLSTAP